MSSFINTMIKEKLWFVSWDLQMAYFYGHVKSSYFYVFSVPITDFFL